MVYLDHMQIIHNKQVIENERKIRVRYQRRSYYLLAILFFLLEAGIAYAFRSSIISPCPQDGCFIKAVYAEDSEPVQKQVIDYIYQKFSPEGSRVVTEALACFISESHLDPLAYHWNSNSTADVGVAQINDIHGLTVQQRQDFKTNIDEAYKIYKASGWNAWYGQFCGK